MMMGGGSVRTIFPQTQQVDRVNRRTMRVVPYSINPVPPPDDNAAVSGTNSVIPKQFGDWESKLGRELKIPEQKESEPRDLAKKDCVYSPYAAGFLSFVAGWSYSDLHTFKDIMERAGIKAKTCYQISVKNDPMFIVSTTQVIRSDNGEIAIVCFRGTELTNTVNWLTDASAKTLEYNPPGCHDGEHLDVHGGFLRNFQAVWPVVVKCLKSDDDKKPEEDTMRKPKLKALYITGRSLGGAMAVLAPMSIYYEKDQLLWESLRGVYTYGQPMAFKKEGDALAKAAFSQPIFRHVYERDVVPRLPPITAGIFEHVGAERKCTGKEWDDKEDDSAQIYTLFLAAPFALVDFVLEQLPLGKWVKMPWSFGDHSPWGYINTLNKTEKTGSG